MLWKRKIKRIINLIQKHKNQNHYKKNLIVVVNHSMNKVLMYSNNKVPVKAIYKIT